MTRRQLEKKIDEQAWIGWRSQAEVLALPRPKQDELRQYQCNVLDIGTNGLPTAKLDRIYFFVLHEGNDNEQAWFMDGSPMSHQDVIDETQAVNVLEDQVGRLKVELKSVTGQLEGRLAAVKGEIDEVASKQEPKGFLSKLFGGK